MLRRSALVLLCAATLVLAGCVVTTAQETPAPQPEDSCGATELAQLIGQPETVLDGMKFAQRVRVLHPGDVMTMDYDAARLNIHIDADGLIATLRCG